MSLSEFVCYCVPCLSLIGKFTVEWSFIYFYCYSIVLLLLQDTLSLFMKVNQEHIVKELKIEREYNEIDCSDIKMWHYHWLPIQLILRVCANKERQDMKQPVILKIHLMLDR